MNDLSFSQMAANAAKLRADGERFTLMGLGPMSLCCIEAILRLAKEKDFPVMLIASRNQVDSDAFGHGYVRAWDQRRFVADTRAAMQKAGFDGLCYFCRDHGGPWQRDEERREALEPEKAMALAEQSYIDDMKSGFDLLHIDPTKDPHIRGTVPLDLVLDRTVALIADLERERKRMNIRPVAYEVGTEETNGGLTSEDAFRAFIERLLARLDRESLPRPAFVVGQTGTLTRLTENVGHFSAQSARALSAIAEGLGVGLKEHNADYLRDAVICAHPLLRVTAANIAPEFGVAETRAYLEMAFLEENFTSRPARSGFTRAITQEAVRCGRWRKWMAGAPTVGGAPADGAVDDVLADGALSARITEISGHYTFETPAVKQALEALTSNLAAEGIDVHEYAVRKIMQAIDRYVGAFRLTGLTGRLRGM